MSEVHPLDLEGPAVYGCAQAGCQACLEALMLHHEGLVHFVLQRQFRSGMAYDDLAQEGRVALWRAVLAFDPQYGAAFSTFAVQFIKYRMWQAIARFKRQQRLLSLPEKPDPLEVWEEAWHRAEVRAALVEAVVRLPDRLREIMIARYELDGQPRRTFKAMGRRFNITGMRVSVLHDDALVLLRLPAYSSRLRSLCGQDSRAGYARTRALNWTWFQKKYRWKRL
jgi:RNA polymerase sigma factor (sigma-70 family)